MEKTEKSGKNVLRWLENGEKQDAENESNFDEGFEAKQANSHIRHREDGEAGHAQPHTTPLAFEKTQDYEEAEESRLKGRGLERGNLGFPF